MNGATRVRDIGMEKQLFIDDYVMDEMEGVSRVLNPAQKAAGNPLLTASSAWEDTTSLSVVTAFYDEEQKCFRMWHTASGGVCYSTSSDGLNWERPPLGLVDFQGSKENNLVAGLPGPTNGVIPYWPEMLGMEHSPRYYKSLCREQDGWAAYYSGDGLMWTIGEKNPVLAHALLGDTCTTNKSSQAFPKGVFYKQAPHPKYLGFPQLRVRVGKSERRCVGFSGCPLTFPLNFVDWQSPILALAPDVLDDELAAERLAAAGRSTGLGLGQQCLAEFLGQSGFRWASIFLGLLWVLNTSDEMASTTDDKESLRDGIVEVQLTSSRDLVHWQRVGEREPILPLGLPGDWDSSRIYPANFPFVLDDEIWIYYTGQTLSQGTVASGIGLAKLRLDGFVSLDAGEAEGTMTTRLLILEGEHLVINAQAREGSVAVEVLDCESHPITGLSLSDCDTFSGDNVRHTVTWQGKSDLSLLQGQPVRLRFYLKKAKLYSFVFRTD